MAKPDDSFDAPRFIKVCGMLASDHEGERASAAMLASRMLRAAGMTWEDALSPPAPQSEAPESPAPPDWKDALADVVDAATDDDFGTLTDWESGFIEDMLEYPREPSFKQWQVIRRLMRKLGAPA